MGTRRMARFSKIRLLMATLLFATPASAEDDDIMRLRRALENGDALVASKANSAELYSLVERMAHYKVPGLSVAVVEDGATVFADAYGDARVGEPATPVTLFQAASISKPVTAVAVMRLVEMGKLNLDADISTYLTSWDLPEGAQDAAHPVTIRRILSHTAGFTVHGFRGYAPDEPVPTVIEVLGGAAPANSPAIYVDQPPGASWRYSGGGYTVLQQLMEDVTGQPFAELMQVLVLEPFGMSHSTFMQPLDGLHYAFAAGAHDEEGKARPTHTYPELAAAGLWTTPSDLAALLVNLMASYRGEGGVLSKASVVVLTTQVSDGMGPGFAVDGQGEGLRLTHGGSNRGFRCFLAAWPERGQGVVLMGNGEQGGPLQREVFENLTRHYGWPG